jgi:poly(hydroxyalkanoate) granule-associated protein
MAKKTEKDLQKDLKETAGRVWLAGLGALATVSEEGGKLFESLVKKGETYEAKGRKKMEKQVARAKESFGEVKDKAEDAWQKFERTLDERVTDVLHRVGVPTRDEIKTLSKRVAELTAKVEQLKPKPRPAAAERAAPK